MIRVTVDKSALRAIVKFAADKGESRYYLTGVLLEADADSVRLVATNGHMMGALNCQYADGDTRAETLTQAIIPAEFIKAIKKPGRRELVCLFVEIDGDKVRFNDGETTREAKLLDAKYPDWRTVMPRGPMSGKVAQFNTAYLWAFTDAQRELGKGLPFATVSHNGDCAALVSIGRDDFVGVLMPLRADAPLDAVPVWALPIAKD